MRISGLVIFAIAGVAAPALAADQNGYQAIVAGDLATAERSIVAERQIYPDRPELMLNLAAVYRKTGRATAPCTPRCSSGARSRWTCHRVKSCRRMTWHVVRSARRRYSSPRGKAASVKRGGGRRAGATRRALHRS